MTKNPQAKRRRWNRPFDYVHHERWSFAYLVLPWRGRWLAWVIGRWRPGVNGLHVIDHHFHNCTRTGVY